MFSDINLFITKFVEVMFSQVSVCPQGRRAWPGACVAEGVRGRGHE